MTFYLSAHRIPCFAVMVCTAAQLLICRTTVPTPSTSLMVVKEALFEWQRQWKRALDNAHRLVVFSNNSAEIVAKTWPDLAYKVDVRPHLDVPKILPYTAALYQKVEGPLSRCSEELGNKRALKLSVIWPSTHRVSVVYIRYRHYR